MRGPVVAIAAAVALLLVLTTVTMFAMGALLDDGDIELTVEGTLDGEEVTGTVTITETNESSRFPVLRATVTLTSGGTSETFDVYLMMGEGGLPDPEYSTQLEDAEVDGVTAEVWEPLDHRGFGFCFDGDAIVGMVITVGGYDCVAS